MYRVLFVCTENSNRSQMAEAFVRLHAADIVSAQSAGSAPSGAVSSVAIQVMRERGYDLSTHWTKALDQVGDGPWDYVITMGCGDACPWIPARHREEWGLQDPKGMSVEGVRGIRDEIEHRVLELVSRLRSERV